MDIKFDFSDKVAIVTGASGGLGKETAVQFARAGAKVIIGDVEISSNLATINKPFFIRKLTEDTEIKKVPLKLEGYDRVIDATGQRAFLGKSREKLVFYHSVQNRVRSESTMIPIFFK